MAFLQCETMSIRTAGGTRNPPTYRQKLGRNDSRVETGEVKNTVTMIPFKLVTRINEGVLFQLV